MKIIKKLKKLSNTQTGISLTREERELLKVKEKDLIEVKKHE